MIGDFWIQTHVLIAAEQKDANRGLGLPFLYYYKCKKKLTSLKLRVRTT